MNISEICCHPNVMRNKTNTITYVLLITACLLSHTDRVLGQEKVNVFAGAGFPELLNVGVRCQTNQTQIGLGVGSMPLNNETIISVSANVRYHFSGYSELSNRRAWYFLIGLNYVRDETEDLLDKYLYLDSRFGRDFNISKKTGIELNAGAIFQLNHEQIASSWNISIDYMVIPSFGMGFFYRI